MKQRRIWLQCCCALLLSWLACVSGAWAAVTQVSAGGTHTAVVKSDGTLWAWGANWYGQLGDGTTTDRPLPVQIGTATNWKSVAAGQFHTVAVKTDGSLWAWGYNGYGELGDDTGESKTRPKQIGNALDWKAVAVGSFHTMALKNDGSLYAWGWNNFGQLGIGGSIAEQRSPTKISAAGSCKSIAAGYFYSVAIRTDGSLYAWGQNTYGQLGDGTTADKDVPVRIGDATNWQSVSAGVFHTVALQTNGTLYTWGRNNKSQLGNSNDGADKNVPTQVGNESSWRAVSAGGFHTLATKTDGSLHVWGDGQEQGGGYGQIGEAVDWSIISAGYFHSAAVKTDGSLYLWGDNGFGQIGCGLPPYNLDHGNSYDYKYQPERIDPDVRWQSVTVGLSGLRWGIKTDGTLWAWGHNADGALGDGTTETRYIPVQIGTDANWQSVSAGYSHVMAIKKDGTLWAWGFNNCPYSALGDGCASERRYIPVRIGTETNWKMVSVGSGYTVALKTDGTLWAWGYNGSGQLGDNTTNPLLVPTKIGQDTDWKMVSAGSNHTVALKTDGRLYAWGLNSSGQLGSGTTTDENSPKAIGEDTWKTVSAGSAHTVAIKTDGTLWAWGDGSSGQLGNGMPGNRLTPVRIGEAANWQTVVAGGNCTMALKTNNSLWSWGSNNTGELGRDTATYAYNIPGQVGTDVHWSSVAAGSGSTAAIKTDGTLWTWGVGYYGQLPDGQTIPAQIGSSTDWKSVTAGDHHAFAWGGYYGYGWGWNGFGQLGDNTTADKSSPSIYTQRSVDSMMSAGGFHYTLELYYGRISAWGNNDFGQLGVGDGTTKIQYEPVMLAGEDWQSVSAGYSHAAAIKTDGSLWAWGRNDSGQLGDETTAHKNSPTAIAVGSTDWQSVSAGGTHTAAIKKDGTLWTWGSNSHGELGNGTTNASSIPTPISTAGIWQSVTAGLFHTFAIKKDGTLWAWGLNTFGILGDDTTTEKHSPVQVGTANNWQSVAAGGTHTVAVRTDGTLWAWGLNASGQLGDGTRIEKHKPVQIIGGTETGWKAAAAGYAFTVAVKTDGTLWSWGADAQGELGDGTSYETTPVKIIPSKRKTVTVSSETHAAITPYPSKTDVEEGSTVSFTVMPDKNYTKNATVGGDCPQGGWEGGNDSSRIWNTGPITADCTVTFNIAAVTHTVTPQTDGNGSVNPSTPQTVNEGSTASFTVTPKAGYTTNADVGGNCPQGSWNGNVWTSGQISTDCTASFSFTLNSYTVTPSAGTGGSISPADSQTVGHGATTSFTVTPDDGYSIASVTGCGGTRNGNTYTTGPITANCIVTASFAVINSDSDGDGIADAWELQHFGNLTTASASSDYDKDGYSDKQEYLNALAGETDPESGAYNPKVKNAPGGTGYVNVSSNAARALPAVYNLLLK